MPDGLRAHCILRTRTFQAVGTETPNDLFMPDDHCLTGCLEGSVSLARWTDKILL